MGVASGFEAIKYLANGRKLNIKGTKAELEAGAIQALNPVAVNEALKLHLASNINPLDIAKWIELDSTECVDEQKAPPEGWLEDWNEGWNYYSQKGEVTRWAAFEQDENYWQLVGQPFEDRLHTLLVDHGSGWDELEGAERYASKRVIAEFSSHTNGFGPVTWDSGSAILEIPGFWLYSHSGDSLESNLLIKKPANPSEKLFEWIESRNALVLFILNRVECCWSDEELANEFNESLWNLSDGAGTFLSVSLSKAESVALFDLIQKSTNDDKKLIKILESSTTKYARALIELLTEAGDDESGHNFMSSDGSFMGLLQKTVENHEATS